MKKPSTPTNEVANKLIELYYELQLLNDYKLTQQEIYDSNPPSGRYLHGSRVTHWSIINTEIEIRVVKFRIQQLEKHLPFSEIEYALSAE